MKYSNNWQSLNTRPVPEWFSDAKFGIFIHWGIYSVPAYAPKGCYAEWYGYHCSNPDGNENDRAYYEHHQKHYPGMRYNDFVSGFRAENFDARQWVGLFADAGARYMNLVSKHHDGFCMWGSKYSPNWNSVDVGPHRDFCAELSEACEGSPVRFGVYHSIYEWFDPLYNADPERYALQKLIPMMKELVEAYRPATLFTDGEWSHPSSVWHSEDFLAWLYNESSVKDFIVPNDRWGSETRGRLGGNLTTEYGWLGAADGNSEMIDRVSEECRGIGASFGYNRFETAEDYLSVRELVTMLVDLVSRGSNFLLNVGPTADGRIPVVMEERLRGIGKWLRVNGEGVYGSRRYCESTTPDTVYTKRGGAVYAFMKKPPRGRVVFRDVPYFPGMSAALLGCEKPLIVYEESGKAAVDFGVLYPDEIDSEHVFTLRLTPAEG
ncbi:MAG: alpha-L-fucosidase [Clostridia bacterium]|nr:alpha-L-fucosidase [Clostridia bacterium]